MRGYFVTGIGTDVGKTVATAVLAEALTWDYWKPVQCGNLDATDSCRVRELAPQVYTLPEVYRLALPASPHAAAAAAGVVIEPSQVRLPNHPKPVLVEGAGGVLVPLNQHHLMVDLMVQLALPVIVVSRSYLGSINHTLLTLALLRARQVPVAGLIRIGTPDPASDDAILAFAQVRLLAHLPLAVTVDRAFVGREAARLRHEKVRDRLTEESAWT